MKKAKTDAKRFLNFIKAAGIHNIYTFGNGGSATIADSMAVDWQKSSDRALYVNSLSANGALLSMIANDYGYERTCSWQLSNLPVNSALVLISSSGNSSNIVFAAGYAKDLGLLVIGFTGFKGGELKGLADLSIHIDSKDYEEAENYHHEVMHEISRLLRECQK